MDFSNYRKYYGVGSSEAPNTVIDELKEFFTRINKIKSPIVSINIPLNNSFKTILSHVYSLSKLKTLFPIELIFIDNNSNDGSIDLLKYIGANIISEKRQGVGFARQLGIDKSKGDIIILGDPDTIYPPNWVDDMTLPFFLNSNIVLNYSTCKSYINKFEIPIKLKIRNVLKIYGIRLLAKLNLKNHYLLVRGHNMAIRKKTAKNTIGFHPDVKYPTDGIFCLQFYALGKVNYTTMKEYPVTELPIN